MRRAARLSELTRVAQIALEQLRIDPDDEQTDADLQRALAERDAAWLAYTTGMEPCLNVSPPTRSKL